MSETRRPLYIPYMGPQLLQYPVLNKGSAFSEEERREFNLQGLLPQSIETIEQQAARAYEQFRHFEQPINQYVFLRNIQDTNETLYYHLVSKHIGEMMPIIYTPTVGQACEHFSHNHRRPRGLFVSYPDRHRIDEILNNATWDDLKVIVVTDGERILGLGDQGIGGMGIPIGKLALYTACGGISPAYTLPIVLDAGTNNQQRLDDPMYLGWRHPRVTGSEYDEFVELFVEAVQRRWPDVLLQFEDFSKNNAMRLLDRYKDRLCCFNDDVQGTASVTVGTLLAACKYQGIRLSEQRITFVGGGSAGCGIAEAVIRQMMSEGISEAQARSQIFMVGRWGLVQENTPNLLPFQQQLAQPLSVTEQWQLAGDTPSLHEVVRESKTSVLIGVSGTPGLFTEEVIREMHRHCRHPIVFPLSNPTSKVEATPEEILRWTEGEAMVACGSPFAPVDIFGKTHTIAQCNNSYIFPGVGLGVLASRASRVTEDMLMAASRALADASPLARDGVGDLLPPLEDIHNISKQIAFAVGRQAMADGKALQLSDEQLQQAIDQMFWHPEYRQYKRKAL